MKEEDGESTDGSQSPASSAWQQSRAWGGQDFLYHDDTPSCQVSRPVTLEPIRAQESLEGISRWRRAFFRLPSA